MLSTSTSILPVSRSRSGPHHGAAQFMQHRPRRLILLQAEHSLQPQRAGAILLGGYPPHGAEPDRQWSPGILEDRPCCHGTLAATASILQQHFAYRPGLVTTTTWTPKTTRPPQPGQVCPTRPHPCRSSPPTPSGSLIFFDHARILVWSKYSSGWNQKVFKLRAVTSD